MLPIIDLIYNMNGEEGSANRENCAKILIETLEVDENDSPNLEMNVV